MCAVLKEGRSCHTQKNANRMSSHSRKILTKRVNQILNEQTCQLLRKNHSSYNLDLETTMLGKLVSNYDFLKKKKATNNFFFQLHFLFQAVYFSGVILFRHFLNFKVLGTESFKKLVLSLKIQTLKMLKRRGKKGGLQNNFFHKNPLNGY